MYHKISEVIPGSLYPGLSVPPRLFERQMRFIASRGFQSVRLENPTVAFHSEKPISITFDDGYQDFADAAVPILDRLRMIGTVFLVNDLIGKTNEWDTQLGDHPAVLMEDQTILDLANKGFEFGSHTRTHVHLDQSDENVQREEIVDSKKRLEETLGFPIQTFCYPYGGYNTTSVNLVKEAGYSCAVTTRKGLNTESTDRFQLNRIAIRNDTLMPIFVYKLWRAFRLGK
jgi:peptidoglycan/xylan/chitin deacetylase (PgdA/CDA1 family)